MKYCIVFQAYLVALYCFSSILESQVFKSIPFINSKLIGHRTLHVEEVKNLFYDENMYEIVAEKKEPKVLCTKTFYLDR